MTDKISLFGKFRLERYFAVVCADMEYILVAMLTLGAAGKLEAQQQKSPGEYFGLFLYSSNDT